MMDMFLDLMDSVEGKKIDGDLPGDIWYNLNKLQNDSKSNLFDEHSEGKANDEVSDKEENTCGPKEWVTGVKCPDIGRTDNFLTQPSG